MPNRAFLFGTFAGWRASTCVQWPQLACGTKHVYIQFHYSLVIYIYKYICIYIYDKVSIFCSTICFTISMTLFLAGSSLSEGT